MKPLVFSSSALLLLQLSIAMADAAEPPITDQDLPRIPAVEPTNAVATFRIKKGFHLELIASEPKVASPVALCFDERGRMFVAEMVDYSERREQNPHLGCIRMLEDRDGDGVYETSSIYADNLPWPTGVFWYNGGLFVIANPDILYLKDTKGSGRADSRQVVFTGFSQGVARVNVQEMPNSLIWGLDNRIHGATSGNGGSVKSLLLPDSKPLDLNGHDFAIEPRAMRMVSEAGGGQHGLSYDNFGRRFTCNNSDHIRMFMYDEAYSRSNPFYDAPPALASIAVDGPAAEVYRVSLEEPWRVVRTRWRIAGVLTGPVEGGGRSSGYFTGATGITIYRGDGFPADFVGDAFVGECAFNLLHHKKLRPEDVGLKAERPGDEQKTEFVASTDNWSRPVQCANAPDGTLYVIDMYREIVEHPWSLPDSIKKHLDLNSGSDRGRIYRIVPEGYKQRSTPRLDKASTTELVALLEHPNGWHRDTAARLLYERQDQSVVPALIRMATDSKSVVGRLHALHALAGLDALTEKQVLESFKAPEEHVREHAIKLAEGFISNGKASVALWDALHGLTSDPAVTVRYQLAFTLGLIRHPNRNRLLEEIIRRDVGSPWIRSAVLISIGAEAAPTFENLWADASFRTCSGAGEFLSELATSIGHRNNPAETARCLVALNEKNSSALSFSAARALGEGLLRAHSSLSKVDPHEGVVALFEHASRMAVDRAAPETARVEAIRLLGFSQDPQFKAALLPLLRAEEREPVQNAAITALGRFSDTDVGPKILQAWNGLAAGSRGLVISTLLVRTERIPELLSAIQVGKVSANELSIAQIKSLRNHRNAEIREQAIKVFGAEDSRPRQQVVEAFQEALHLAGRSDHGKAIYLERCASCHRFGESGYAVGPDLLTVRNHGKEKILNNILDPNREVVPAYIAFEIETEDGESSTGIIANETTSTITVRQAQGKTQVISRGDIKHMRSLGQSIMPEGLEQGLKPQDLADLLEYVTTSETK